MLPPVRRTHSRPRRLLVAAALVFVTLTLAAVVVAVVAPSHNGMSAVVAIGLPYALLVAGFAVVVALLAPRRVAVVLVVAAAATALLVAPGVTGLLPHDHPVVPEGLVTARFVTYNTYIFDHSPFDRLLASLAAQGPAIVGLQEVTPERAAAIEADPALTRLYPYREMRASAPGGGEVLLSSWPITARPEMAGVSLIEATVQADGRSIAVLVVHAPLPLALDAGPFNPERRDTMLGAFRARIDARMSAGDPVVLMGDLNTTDRELVFRDLSAGLIDVHAAVGSGLGHTWRVRTQSIASPPLFRIDHMLLSPDLVPVATGVDCDASASDHCLLWGTVGWTRAVDPGDTVGTAAYR